MAVAGDADPVADGTGRLLGAVEPLAMNGMPLQCPAHALDHTLYSGLCGANDLLLQPVAAHRAVSRRAMARSFSNPAANAFGTVPGVPNRLTRARSSAPAAVVAFPNRERWQ